LNIFNNCVGGNMVDITNNRVAEYKAALRIAYKDLLTTDQLNTALSKNAIRLLDAQSTGGTVDTMATYLSWIQTKPKAIKYLTKEAAIQTDLVAVLTDAGLAALQAADILPATYITLHNEDITLEPKISGLIALRAANVGSNVLADTPNLTGTTGSGAALTDANVTGFYATWGADKYKAILNKSVLNSIVVETDTSYDTLAEVAALYSAWTNTIPAKSFFAGLAKVAAKDATVKFSDMMTYASDLPNFNLVTSDNAVKLMGTTGGSMATIVGMALGSAKFKALTSAKAMEAIDKGAATYTLMNAAYTVSPYKLDAVLSDDARAVMRQGLAGLDFSGLSTGYGGTYSTAADKKFRDVVKYGLDSGAFKKGITYANIAATYDTGKLGVLGYAEVDLLDDNGATANTVFAALVPATAANLAGYETLPEFV
jgi:hypothetical protein